MFAHLLEDLVGVGSAIFCRLPKNVGANSGGKKRLRISVRPFDKCPAAHLIPAFSTSSEMPARLLHAHGLEETFFRCPQRWQLHAV